jgi:hypothetical protein
VILTLPSPLCLGEEGKLILKKFFKNILDNFKKGAIILIV